jgi:hypothetical protein
VSSGVDLAYALAFAALVKPDEMIISADTGALADVERHSRGGARILQRVDVIGGFRHCLSPGNHVLSVLFGNHWDVGVRAIIDILNFNFVFQT